MVVQKHSKIPALRHSGTPALRDESPVSRRLRTSLGAVVLPRLITTVALVCVPFSTLRNYPHELVYFNELSGGASSGDKHLLHSSLDWGQDLLMAARWQSEHPSSSRAFYFVRSSFDPRAIGLRGRDLRQANWCDSLLESMPQSGALLLVSKHYMLKEHASFKRLDTTTVDTIGMSIVVVRVAARRPRSTDCCSGFCDGPVQPTFQGAPLSDAHFLLRRSS